MARRKADLLNKLIQSGTKKVKKTKEALTSPPALAGTALYAATETPMPGRGGETSLEPIVTNPMKSLKTFIKMELEGKKIGDVSTRDILKYVEENPSYARRIYNRLVKGGEFNADELIKKVTKRSKEKGLKPYDFDKKVVKKKRDGGIVSKKKPVKKKTMKKSIKGTKWESKWG